MPLVEFVGRRRQDGDNIAASPARIINFYRETTGSDKSGFVLKSVLGTTPFADIGGVFLRDMKAVGSKLFAVVGGALYCVDALGDITNLGAVEDSEETTISSNNGKVTVAAGGTYYVWDDPSLTTPSTGAFSSVGAAAFIGQYTVVTERSGRRFQWSDVADPASFDPLDFATAEGRDDDIIRPTAISGNLWLFGEASTEIWYPTGQAGPDAFQRLSGGVLDIGLKSYGLLASFDGGAFFIGDDGIAYITGGSGLQPVSEPSVETSISQNKPTRCFFYEDEGHKFCVIRFTDRPAWGYDVSSGEWHERSFGEGHAPWPAVSAVKFGSSWYLGTDVGQIHKFARVSKDAEAALVRTAVSKTLYIDGNRTRISELEFFPRVGESFLGRNQLLVLDAGGGFYLEAGEGYLLEVDEIADAPRDAKIWIRTSRDGGRTWGDPKERSMGDLGDYVQRTLYRSLGQYRSLTVEVNISDPIEAPLLSSARVIAT